MKIILSPAKKMIVDTDNLVLVELPVYIDKTAEVLNWIKSKSKEELKAIWKCNDKIAEQNFNRLENMNLYNRLTPAVLAYEGIAFQYMAPSVFEIQQFEYSFDARLMIILLSSITERYNNSPQYSYRFFASPIPTFACISRR